MTLANVFKGNNLHFIMTLGKTNYRKNYLCLTDDINSQTGPSRKHCESEVVQGKTSLKRGRKCCFAHMPTGINNHKESHQHM